ncbi:tetratricopeptide repeat protein [Vreelandella sp. EE27]
MKKLLYRTLCSLTTAAVALTAAMPAYSLDEDIQAVKDEGMRLYNSYQRSKSEPYLKTAAEAGDVEAMYYLGEVYRLRHMGLTNDAMDWYYEAAQHGEPYAMLRLHSGGACKLGDVCPDNGDDWRDAALEETLPKAEDGDTDAMLALYSIYATLEDMDAANHWLLEAAEADNTDAQDWLGRKIISDHEGYNNDTEDFKAAEIWFRRAAEHGYGPSMKHLSSVLLHLERTEEAYEWLMSASNAGLVDARLGVAWCYLEPERDAICSDEQNTAAGTGILEAMIEEINKTEVQFLLDNVAAPLGNEQREEANEIKAEWLNQKPPLSYFPAKFGY